MTEPKIVFPPESLKARPLNTVNAPSVAMNGKMPNVGDEKSVDEACRESDRESGRDREPEASRRQQKRARRRCRQDLLSSPR